MLRSKRPGWGLWLRDAKALRSVLYLSASPSLHNHPGLVSLADAQKDPKIIYHSIGGPLGERDNAEILIKRARRAVRD